MRRATATTAPAFAPPTGGSPTSEDADHRVSDPSPALDAIAQLRGVEGRIHELQRLIETDAMPMEVLGELAAATEALQRVSVALVGARVHRGVVEAATDPDRAEGVVADTVRTIERLLRS